MRGRQQRRNVAPHRRPNRHPHLRTGSIRPRLATPARSPRGTTKRIERQCAEFLERQQQHLTAQLDVLVQQINPALRVAYGVGADTAARLLVAAGTNPYRLCNDASFAALCGAAPVPSTSGKMLALVRGNDCDFKATDITGKLAMRASIQCDIELNGCRVDADAMLPGACGLRGPLTCLDEARYGIVWGVMGAARSAYESTLDYTKQRKQFGRPIASFQLVQKQLVDMAIAVNRGTLLALHLGRLSDAGRLASEQISIGKLDNTRNALEVTRTARALLGGNGITLDHPVMRHMVNLEAPYTYEGTAEIHTLIVGHALTSIRAFV